MKLGDAKPNYNQPVIVQDSTESVDRSFYSIHQKNIELEPGELQVGHKVIKRVPMSLCCLSTTNPCRKLSARISEHRAFEMVIIVFIIANMIGMACRDYTDIYDKSERNRILEYIDYVFSGVFIIEAVLKIITSGFICGRRTYLRQAWNVIDFVIVLAAVIQIGLSVFNLQDGSLGGLKSLRILRVLRPLKAVKSMPAIRLQVAALLKSLKQLANVMIFLASMIFLAGVMGLQLFMHSVHYACRETEEPLPGATTWPKTDDRVCSRPGDNDHQSYSGYRCPEGTFCGSPLDYGLEMDRDIHYNASLQYGFGIFENIGDAFFTVSQMITMDNWTAIMYNLAQHESLWLPSLYAVFIIFIGSFLLLNLTLAVIMDSYDTTAQQMDMLQKEQLEQEKRDIEQRINQRRSMTDYANVNKLVFMNQERIMEVFGNKFREQLTKIRLQKRAQAEAEERSARDKASSGQPQPTGSDKRLSEASQGSSRHRDLDNELLGEQPARSKPAQAQTTP